MQNQEMPDEIYTFAIVVRALARKTSLRSQSKKSKSSVTFENGIIAHISNSTSTYTLNRGIPDDVGTLSYQLRYPLGNGDISFLIRLSCLTSISIWRYLFGL